MHRPAPFVYLSLMQSVQAQSSLRRYTRLPAAPKSFVASQPITQLQHTA